MLQFLNLRLQFVDEQICLQIDTVCKLAVLKLVCDMSCYYVCHR